MGSRFGSKSLFVRFAGILIAVVSGWAQSPANIEDLVACLNSRLANQGNVDMSAAVDRCMPQGCKVTASMSTSSAQPACNISNTQLPRVYLNCPGPSPGLRFRPTFTLCPNDANRIEAGDDVSPISPSPAVPMKMANIPISMNQPFHGLTNYLNTPNNNLRCTRCHGNASPEATGDTPLLSSPFDPFTTQRRNLLPFVVYSTEPTRKALISPTASVAGVPVTAQSLDQICARIRGALEINPNAYGSNAPVLALCNALSDYTNNRSCGQGIPNARCSGVVGGGIFVHNGASSTVALEFSGQALSDVQTAERTVRGPTVRGPSEHGLSRLVFGVNDVDGVLTASSSSTQTNINAVLMSHLERIDGIDDSGIRGDGNFVIRGTGKAWVNGVARDIAVQISFNKTDNVSGVTITSPDGAEFYAGGTSVGVRFTLTPAVP